MKNKYARRSRISEGKVRELVRYFAADLTALQAATLSGLNRNTVNRFYRGLRERILLACEAQRPLFDVVEVGESFFGARRAKGRRGRGAYGKTVVFGIFEHQGQVHTEIVPDCSRPTPQGIIRVAESLGSLYREVSGGDDGQHLVGEARRFLQGLGAEEWDGVRPQGAALSGTGYKCVWEVLSGQAG